MAIVTFSNGIKVNFNGNPTQADIEEVAKKISNKPQDVNVLGSAISGATQAFQQKETATFNPLKIADKYFTSIGETAVDAWNRLKEIPKLSEKTTAGKIATTGEAGLGIVNTILSPISSAFKAGEAVPGLGYIATGINSLFGAVGSGSSALGNNALNRLPVSDQTKEELRPVVNEASALAGQIALGKTGLESTFRAKTGEVLKILNNGMRRELPPEIASKMPEITSEPTPTAPTMPPVASKPAIKENPYTQKEINDIKRNVEEVKAISYKDRTAMDDAVLRQGEEFLEKQKQYNVTQPEISQTKPSGIAKGIEKSAIEKGFTEAGFDELAGYDASTKKVQAELGSKYNIDQHIEMVKTGELPKGMKPGTPFSVVEKYANETKNIELQRELAKSPLATKISESASELSLSRMREKEGAVSKIKEVIDSRKEKFKDQIKAETVKIKKSVGKPTKESWLKFIEEIKC